MELSVEKRRRRIAKLFLINNREELVFLGEFLLQKFLIVENDETKVQLDTEKCTN